MSKTIDEKVVEMRFDNKQFESNVATSMSTLEKLKRSLKFDGASKGLEDIEKASGKVNMSGLGGAVETVKAKFSALDVVAVTALANITNSAVNAGKRIISALTIDPVKTGFQEYETQIKSIQTILANTQKEGTDVERVNAALDELNKYADMTIYNFTEMTRNIGTFTAAGVKLDTSVNAIKGIANLAAVSGSTSQQASVAMYQLSQALASGKVKLMDWNSVVNAGMGGQVFQDALIRTSEHLQTGAKAAIEAEGSFRDSLTTGWLTTEVLTETLDMFATAAGTQQEYEAAVKKFVEKGYTEEEAKQMADMARTAGEAATKVKTFTQLWDVLKEAAQSGWSQTWRIIIGDFEEAKNLFSPLSEFLTDFINKTSDWRNNILEGAFDFAKPWKSITDKLNGAGFDKIKGVADSFEKVTEKVKSASDKLEYFQDVVNRVWNGDFNNWGDNLDRRDLLKAAGYDPRVVQELVNKGYQYKLTIEDIEAAHKKFGLTMETTAEETKKTTEEFGKLTDEQLEQAGLTKDEISLYRALEKEAKRLGVSVGDLAKEMSEKDGRTLFIESFKNAADGLIGIGKAIKNAWVEIFNPPGVGELAIKLYGIARSVNDFSEKLRLTDKETGELNETGKKIQRTFKGIFAILNIITTILGGGFRFAIQVVSKILSAFNLDVLDVTANIGDALVAFRDWVLEGNILAKSFDWLISKIPVVVNIFKEWFNVFKQTPAVQKLIDSINAIVDSFRKLTSGEININEFARSLGENLAKVLKSLPGIAIQIGKDFIAGFKNGISDSISGAIKSVISFCLNFVKGFAEALGVHSPSWKAFDIAVDFFRGLINGIKSMAGPVTGILKKIGEVIVKVFKSFWDFITDESGNIEWGKLFAGGSIVGMLLILKKFADAFGSFANILDGVGDLLKSTGKAMKSFSKVLNGVAWDLKAKALMKMSISIAILVASIWALTQIDDPTKLQRAIIIVGILAVVLVILSIAMSKLSSASVTLDKESKKLDIKGIQNSLLQIGLAIMLVALAVKMMGDMSPEEVAQGFKRLAVIASGILAFLSIMGLVSIYAKNVTGIGGMMVKLSLAMILMVGVCKLIGSLSEDEMLKGAAFAIAFGIFVIAITKVAKSAGNNVSKVGGMVIKVTIAMALMVGLCKLINLLSVDEMRKGAAFATAFVIFVKTLVSSSKMGKKQQLANVGRMILSISVSLMLLVGVCKLVGMLSLGEMVKGVVFVAGFVILLKKIVSILKIGNEEKIAKATGIILAMSAAIGILAAVSILLGFVDLPSLAKGVGAVMILCTMMALMIHGLKGAQNVKGSIMMMAIAIGIIAASVAALSFIDTTSLITAAGAMTIMMVAFSLMIKSMKRLGNEKVPVGPIIALLGVIIVLTGVLYALKDINPASAIASAVSLSLLAIVCTGLIAILSKLGAKSGGAIVGVIALAALGLVLREFVWVLASMDDLKNARANAITLSILATVCTVLVAILSLLGVAAFGALAGVVALAALGLVLREFVWVLASMEGLKNARENAITLCILATVCTVLVGLLAIIGIGIVTALAGCVALAALGLVLREFVWVLASMEGLNNAMDNALVLELLMTTLADVLVKISLLGPLAFVGESAITGLIVLIGAIGTMAVAIGYLMEKFPAIQKFLDTGLTVLEQLSSGIGKMIGNFIGGIGEGLSDSFIKIGDNIAEFMSKLVTASDNAAKIKAESFNGVEKLIGVMALIGAETVGTSIADIFTLGGTSIDKFEEDGVAFFNAMKAIGEASSGASNINSSNIATAIDASYRIKDLINALSGLDTSGLTAFTGIGTGGVGADGAAYEIAQTISDFSSKVSGISIEAVSVSVDAATKLKSLIYSLSGLDTSGIENFKVGSIGDQMKSYSDKVAGIDTANVSSSISNAERLKSFIYGLAYLDASGIENFKAELIGTELNNYAASISGTNMNYVSSSITVADDLRVFIGSLARLNTSGVNSFKTAMNELSTINIDGFVEAFSESSAKLSSAGANMINGLINGMQSKLPDIKNMMASIYSLFYNAGSYLVTGFCNGISENSYKAAAKAKAMAEEAVEAAREALKINSPSKVFKKIGSGIPEGFAIGIGMLGGEVRKSVTGMASSAINTTRSAMANVLDALNNGMDTQPRIRPVVDLSDVHTGVNAINGMFDGVQTVGISSNFNAINASMNRKLQNGTNDDVISAINKLGYGLEKNRGDTYNFGDFTYDSGSEIADAVGTLIRYAKIGRRV